MYIYGYWGFPLKFSLGGEKRDIFIFILIARKQNKGSYRCEL